ncbi:MAG: response regulator [Anaerolineaceae bacterium]
MPSQEKIRTLLVDDITETRENLRRLLQFDVSIEVIGEARGGREAIELAAKLKPEVVVMDINMPDMDGIQATEGIRKKVPYCQVIILSVQNDMQYMRRAMVVGARDFLTKPPTIDELTIAVHRAGETAKDEFAKYNQSLQLAATPGSTGVGGSVNGKIIAVYSPKGGTGCTSIATNLALAMDTSLNKVALVDSSMQYGDIPIFINEQLKNSVLDLTVHSDELDPELVQEVVVKQEKTGLHVLAAPPRPELAEKVVGDQFGQLLNYMRNLYNYIIVDTSTYLSEAVQSVLDIADAIVLITTQDIPAIKNASSFLLLADALGISRKRVLFVLNKFDRRVAILPERITVNLKQEVILSIPLDDRFISNSINRGIPLFLENKTHPFSKSMITLAEMVKQRLETLEGTF